MRRFIGFLGDGMGGGGGEVARYSAGDSVPAAGFPAAVTLLSFSFPRL